MSSPPVILSSGRVQKLVNDRKLHEKLPEFSVLKKFNKAKRPRTSGCRSCNEKTAQVNVLRVFIQIVERLDTAKLDQLKKHMGTERLQYYHFNNSTGSYEAKVI
jgi:hypothetical protein